ncbi:MAG: glutamate 5-kinase [Chloroflexi bacterium 44-23]|nr:MAG: glutamate 5-kinase [Chloroflexi bacterium 44-23]
MEPQRIVIKLGSSTLTQGKSDLAVEHMLEIVRVVARLHLQGHQVMVVSSGAITVGRSMLGDPILPKHMPAKQMLAAVGQSRLMELYSQLFGFYHIAVGQVLLTREDLSSRRRYLNARNTLEALIQYRVIPIINENDTVSTEEIRLGDNDNLSALVANVIEADLLILLTDQDGLFTADPRNDPAARLVSEINSAEIDAQYWQAAGGSSSNQGTGGMYTKLQAAQLARQSGVEVVIINGARPELIAQIVNGQSAGTRFSALCSKLESRKRYMLAEARNSDAAVEIDSGAVTALHSGKSLLPVGIKSISGEFQRGDIIHIRDLQHKDIALGMVNYGSADLSRLVGLQSQEIEQTLGYTYGVEVLHHNNLLFV